uniref:Uncharacterized protein n=1 Tax=Candidatus Methanogaster sp. ANME-2c ERB4 TaxID=2759911 RepID=A0A7G9YD52_9EURY|nr:hypothetical protein DMJHIOCL_00015 [Methanosarcinales archaeon ANME-2c ERB4]
MVSCLLLLVPDIWNEEGLYWGEMLFRGGYRAVWGENRMNQTELFDIRMRAVAKTSLPEYR